MKKRKNIDLDKVEQGLNKVEQGIENGVKITRIILRITWILIGVAALAAFIFVAVRIGQVLKVDLSNLFG